MALEKFALSFFLLLMQCVAAFSGERIIIQSTTSTANSGLLSHILPKFEAATGIEAHVVAVGTGQALKNAANGDGDILLVHSKAAEEGFVAEGWGVKRFDVMYNDFVLVGLIQILPKSKGRKMQVLRSCRLWPKVLFLFLAETIAEPIWPNDACGQRLGRTLRDLREIGTEKSDQVWGQH